MKLLFTILIFLATMSANACLSKIAEYEKWQPLTVSQVRCMASQEVTQGLHHLCSPDGKDLSEQFKKYISFKAESDAAFQKYKDAKDAVDRSTAALELQQVKNNWSVFGYKYEVESNLYEIESIRRGCLEK